MGNERAIAFDCRGERLIGIVHQPAQSAVDTGVVLVVGGPQYRVGSHRQFVLLARSLAAAGIPVLRFDFRGMGDSSGGFREFEHIQDDIATAVDALCSHVPGVERIVLWGLCDAATANAFYALTDKRIVGQIAANPWVRTTEGEAQAFVRHYYLKRLLSTEFWKKVFSLEFRPLEALRDFARKLIQSRGAAATSAGSDNRPLPQRLHEAQTRYEGSTLLILSGQDLTAREYEDRVADIPAWSQWLSSDRVTVHRLDAADHTFSTAAWRDQVAAWSRDWLLSLK